MRQNYEMFCRSVNQYNTIFQSYFDGELYIPVIRLTYASNATYTQVCRITYASIAYFLYTVGLVGYSQLVYPLSQTALSQKPVSWKAVSQPVSKLKKD